LCEESCATSVQRARQLDGIAVRAWPFTPRTPLPASSSLTFTQAHLRSRLASARFADETVDLASLLAGADLSASAWCNGACAPSAGDVPLAVLVRAGSSTLFVDEWTARRELMETPPRRYWAGRMGLRPLAVFLAQVLQFQCQLSDILPSAISLPRLVLNEAVVSRLLEATDEAALRTAISNVQLTPVALQPPTTRVLISGGIVELPPAGYLPVDVDATVNDQMRKLLGEGVDLTFCVVRPDYIPHALESSQHDDRISLTSGLDNPADKQAIEILVPDGEIVRALPTIPGTGWDGHVSVTPAQAQPVGVAEMRAAPAPTGFASHGAGRSESVATGGAHFYFAGTTQTPTFSQFTNLAHGLVGAGGMKVADFDLLNKVAIAHADDEPPPDPDDTMVTNVAAVAGEASEYIASVRVSSATEAELGRFQPTIETHTQVMGMWAALGCDRNPFSLGLGELSSFNISVDLAVPGSRPTVLEYDLRGDFRVERILPVLGTGRRVYGTLSGIGATRAVVNGSSAATHAGAFERAASIVFSDLPNDPPTLDIAIPPNNPEGVGYDIHVTWDGSPLTAAVTVRVTHEETTLVVPLGSFTQNADVLVEGNQTNTLARSGLAIVAAALAQPAFLDTAEGQLFPPPLAPATELTVKPQRNWVFFHRPRVKTCAPDLVVVPPPARNYDVFMLKAGNADQVEAVRTALWKNEPAVITRLEPRYVGRFQFTGGEAALATVATTVRADWRAAQPAANIEYAAIADIGQGDGDVLARSRLISLEQTLAGVATVDDGALAEAVPAAPPALVRPGADGVIIVVTEAAVKTTCMLAIAAMPRDSQTLKEFLAQLGTDKEVASYVQQALSTTASFAEESPLTLRSLGQALFDVGAATIDPASAWTLQSAWNDLDSGGVVSQVWAFDEKGAAGAEPSLLAPRGLQVAQAVGGANASTHEREIGVALPGGCPSVAFLVVQPEQPT